MSEDDWKRASVVMSYAALNINSIPLGVTFAMCIYGFILWSQSNTFTRRRRAPYIIFSFAMLAVTLISEIARSVSLSSTLTQHSDHPHPIVYGIGKQWWDFIGTTFELGLALLGEGIMLYRCYILWWSHKKAVLLAPLTGYLSAIALIAYFLYRQAVPNVTEPYMRAAIFNSIWFFLVAVTNVMITGLILLRLYQWRRTLSKAMDPSESPGHYAVYDKIAIMVIESSLPHTIFQFAAAVLCPFAMNSISLSCAYMMFSISCKFFNVLCTQLLIFRVTVGISWTNDPLTTPRSSNACYTDSGQGTLAEPICFRQTNQSYDGFSEISILGNEGVECESAILENGSGGGKDEKSPEIADTMSEKQ